MRLPGRPVAQPTDNAMLRIALANQQKRHRVDRRRLIAAAKAVLRGEGIREADVSLAVVDDDTIQALNRRDLHHDYATDVLSYVFHRAGDRVEGEVVVSADRASAVSSRYGWGAGDELLLYVIHGTLHLVGYDDRTSRQRASMQSRERQYLAEFGLTPS